MKNRRDTFWLIIILPNQIVPVIVCSGGEAGSWEKNMDMREESERMEKKKKVKKIRPTRR